MSKVYFPFRFLDVPASPPHEGRPAYRVSVRMEHWSNGSAQQVYKTQMVYDGVVAGRKSPSYPEGTDDVERVYDAMRRIKAGEGQIGRGQMSSAGTEPGISLRDTHEMIAVHKP